MILKKIYISFLMVLLSTIVFASEESHFDKGVEDYQNESYKKALEHFEMALEMDSNNISAYYNLGLTALELNEYSKAIWAFETVLKFKPNDSDCEEHLNLANLELTNEPWEPRLSSFSAGLYSVSSNSWAIVAIIASCIFLLSVIILKSNSNISLKRGVLVLSFVATCVIILSSVLSYNVKNYRLNTTAGIVLKKSIPAFKNPNAEATSTFAEGTRLSITSSDSLYYIVKDLEGNDFFVFLDDLKAI